MNKNAIQDPLRPLSEVFKLAKGNACFNSTLENDHQILSQIVLHESVPSDVRQLFETAKNLSLYSWFVYRFHQVAELISFAAMEMSLRKRYLEENPSDDQQEADADGIPKRKSRPPSLSWLLKHAKDEKWIDNSGFSYSYELACRNAQERKFLDIIRSGILDEVESAEIPEPTEDEINQSLSELSIVDNIVNYAPKIRNDLAHGSTQLSPGSISSLRKAADVINQVYPKE